MLQYALYTEKMLECISYGTSRNYSISHAYTKQQKRNMRKCFKTVSSQAIAMNYQHKTHSKFLFSRSGNMRIGFRLSYPFKANSGSHHIKR